jgi:dethiobiotin synthetase
MTSAASGLVLVSPAGVPDELAERLASLLECDLLPPLPRDAQAPDPLLQALVERSGAWLQPLTAPPAQDLERASCWAELLGAWRLPTCLLVSEAERCNGQARSQVILLQHYRVPLLGVVQCGGGWRSEERRRDGLPWLGTLPEGTSDPAIEEQLQLKRCLESRLGPARLE